MIDSWDLLVTIDIPPIKRKISVSAYLHFWALQEADGLGHCKGMKEVKHVGLGRALGLIWVEEVGVWMDNLGLNTLEEEEVEVEFLVDCL